ncbi:hypothetical protein EG327_010680 [Venturia inaequalis]|uniref:BTB domain-containing protein n=1 Tax=Venturia inaequalis TaxID=5025 RepID=A0A8H3VRY5_VENIN|nr:hypothetical protein EG327_010680 [Venturia inaequalis]
MARTTVRNTRGGASSSVKARVKGFCFRTQFKTCASMSTILIGPEKTPYVVHRDLICSQSPFFTAALRGSFLESSTQSLELPDIDTKCFDHVILWLYQSRLEPLSYFFKDGKATYFTLLDLYATADQLDIEGLRNGVVDLVAELAEVTNSVPTPTDTWILYDGVRDSAKLRELVLDLFAFKKTDNLIATHPDEWHPSFLRDLVCRLKRPGPKSLTRHALERWQPAGWGTSGVDGVKACERAWDEESRLEDLLFEKVLQDSAGVVAFAILQSIYNSFKPGIRDLPGPWLAKYTDLLRVYWAWKGDAWITFQRLKKEYGNAVRVGPNTILLSEQGQFDKILGFKEDFAKSDSMKVWTFVQDGKPVRSIAAMQDKKAHANLKRPVVSIYSMSNMITFEPIVDDTIRYFLKRLDETFMSGSNTGKSCDIDNWVQYFAFDVVGEFTLSSRFGFLEQGHDIENMLHDLDAQFSYNGCIQTMPILDKLLKKNPIYMYLKSPNNKFILKARSLIHSRLSREKQTGRPDLMDRFLEAQQKHPGIVTNQILGNYVATNFIAGSDTTAIVLRAILYYAIRTPGVLAKLREELDSSGTTYPVPYKIAQHLPYLDATIREAMRMHHIVSVLFERTVPASGYTLPNGTKLPQGTVIGMIPWTLNFDEEIWGPEPDSFKPERWLQGEGEAKDVFEKRLAVMKHNDFSFSYGPRVCLGRHIATLEVWKVMPTMLGLLDIEFVHPEKEWRVEGSFFARQFDMDVRMKWREGVNRELYIENHESTSIFQADFKYPTQFDPNRLDDMPKVIGDKDHTWPPWISMPPCYRREDIMRGTKVIGYRAVKMDNAQELWDAHVAIEMDILQAKGPAGTPNIFTTFGEQVRIARGTAEAEWTRNCLRVKAKPTMGQIEAIATSYEDKNWLVYDPPGSKNVRKWDLSQFAKLTAGNDNPPLDRFVWDINCEIIRELAPSGAW